MGGGDDHCVDVLSSNGALPVGLGLTSGVIRDPPCTGQVAVDGDDELPRRWPRHDPGTPLPDRAAPDERYPQLIVALTRHRR